jgi:hypothetical protein
VIDQLITQLLLGSGRSRMRRATFLSPRPATRFCLSRVKHQRARHSTTKVQLFGKTRAGKNECSIGISSDGSKGESVACVRASGRRWQIKNKAIWKEPRIMKQVRLSFKMISVMSLLALTVGCATTSSTQNKESLLVASGFKVITPKTAAQQQKLQQLPPGHVAVVNRNGRTYYIFPDAAHNQAYVGGPKEYQAYQQMRAVNNIAAENLETAEMYQDAAMQWGAWGGWGMGWGPMGMGVGVGRFR